MKSEQPGSRVELPHSIFTSTPKKTLRVTRYHGSRNSSPGLLNRDASHSIGQRSDSPTEVVTSRRQAANRSTTGSRHCVRAGSAGPNPHPFTASGGGRKVNRIPKACIAVCMAPIDVYLITGQRSPVLSEHCDFMGKAACYSVTGPIEGDLSTGKFG